MTTSLDTPAKIGAWRVLSAVSQLALEIKTGQNYYGRTSVYKAIRLHFIDGLPERATLRNKCLALATFLTNLPEDIKAGPVCTSASQTLATALAENGWTITMPTD